MLRLSLPQSPALLLLLAALFFQGCLPTSQLRQEEKQTTGAWMPIQHTPYLADQKPQWRFGRYHVQELQRNTHPITKTDEQGDVSSDIGHYQGYAFHVDGSDSRIVGACTAEKIHAARKEALECSLHKTNTKQRKQWKLELKGQSQEAFSGELAKDSARFSIVRKLPAGFPAPTGMPAPATYILHNKQILAALPEGHKAIWLNPALSPSQRDIVASATAALLLLQKMPHQAR